MRLTIFSWKKSSILNNSPAIFLIKKHNHYYLNLRNEIYKKTFSLFIFITSWSHSLTFQCLDLPRLGTGPEKSWVRLWTVSIILVTTPERHLLPSSAPFPENDTKYRSSMPLMPVIGYPCQLYWRHSSMEALLEWASQIHGWWRGLKECGHEFYLGPHGDCVFILNSSNNLIWSTLA